MFANNSLYAFWVGNGCLKLKSHFYLIKKHIIYLRRTDFVIHNI